MCTASSCGAGTYGPMWIHSSRYLSIHCVLPYVEHKYMSTGASLPAAGSFVIHPDSSDIVICMYSEP